MTVIITQCSNVVDISRVCNEGDQEPRKLDNQSLGGGCQRFNTKDCSCTPVRWKNRH